MININKGPPCIYYVVQIGMWKTKVVVPYLPNFVEDTHSFSCATNNANARAR